MQKIVVNKVYGGFSVSKKVFDMLGLDWDGFGYIDRDRDDPELVKAVEELGKEANGRCAQLKIVSIPDDVEWIIGSYDGLEWVAEVHRTWS